MPVWLAWPFIKGLLGGWLKAAWDFVRQPPGSYVALVCAVLLSWWLSGQIGYDRGFDQCEANHRIAAQHEVARQEKVGAVVRKDSDARTQPHAAEDRDNRTVVRTIYVHDKALPDADYSCVDPADADRLRELH